MVALSARHTEREGVNKLGVFLCYQITNREAERERGSTATIRGAQQLLPRQAGHTLTLSPGPGACFPSELPDYPHCHAQVGSLGA